jgi:hypothetical protein
MTFVSTALSQTDLDTQRFKFLSKLIQKGKMTVGENMYLIGQQLGFNRELVDDIVRYYHRHEVIVFPVLGPYIKLVNDWYNVLDERDRTLLKEGFILTLDEMTRSNLRFEVSSREVFDTLGYHAFSESLVPAIVESLVSENLIGKENDNIIITNQGRNRCTEIRERNRILHEQTLRRLGATE